MPVKKAGDTPPINNRDIRQYITPPRLNRNRRIVESDSSDGQAPQHQNEPQHTPPDVHNDGAPELQNEPQQTPPVVHNDGDQIPQLIQIDDSDDDSSDSMYVAVIRPRDEAQNQHNDENAIPPQQQSLPRNVRPRNAVQNAFQSHQRQGQHTPQRQGPIAPLQRQQPQPNPRRKTRQTRATSCIGEAESTSESESSAMSADESSENAADLYRSAILGVRNRPNAVRQVS